MFEQSHPAASLSLSEMRAGEKKSRLVISENEKEALDGSTIDVRVSG